MADLVAAAHSFALANPAIWQVALAFTALTAVCVALRARLATIWTFAFNCFLR